MPGSQVPPRMPGEWEPHASTWIAWPHHEGDWPGKLAAIPWVYAEIVRVIAPHERVEILCQDKPLRDALADLKEATAQERAFLNGVFSAGGFAGGAVMGWLVGALKARTGAHEVIVTIMLNYVALYLLAYLLVLDVLALLVARFRTWSILTRPAWAGSALLLAQPLLSMSAAPHWLTRLLLLSAAPEIDMETELSDAVRSDPTNIVTGQHTACPFADRCPMKLGKICDKVQPPWRFTSETHALRCHIPLDDLRQRETTPQQLVPLQEAVPAPRA